MKVDIRTSRKINRRCSPGNIAEKFPEPHSAHKDPVAPKDPLACEEDLAAQKAPRIHVPQGVLADFDAQEQ